jgi:hypothetical protein
MAGRLLLSLLAGGTTGAASDPAASTVLRLLRELPALPVPHYSWPFCHLENSCTASAHTPLARDLWVFFAGFLQFMGISDRLVIYGYFLTGFLCLTERLWRPTCRGPTRQEHSNLAGLFFEWDFSDVARNCRRS